MEFGGGGPRTLAIAVTIALKLPPDDWDARVTPVIVRLFNNPDRALRVSLLEQLPRLTDRLSAKITADKIFPPLTTGFADTAPLVREQTVKAVLAVAPKLPDRVLNGELLRLLARTAHDDQPGIRTNTTICLGKLARLLTPATRAKVLRAAFARALRDPFVPARAAALQALAATADLFAPDDCAAHMLPALCPALVDRDRGVRDHAQRALHVYLERVRAHAATLPDAPAPAASSSLPATRVATPQPGGGGVGAQVVGWAISSFTHKLGAPTGAMEPAAAAAQRPAPAASAMLAAPRPAVTHTQSTPAVTQVGVEDGDAGFDDDDDVDGWGAMASDGDDDDGVVGAWGTTTATGIGTGTKGDEPGFRRLVARTDGGA